MKRWIAISMLSVALALGLVGAFTSTANATSTGTPGQPSQSCQAQTAAPPGFGTAGFANAETRYAGSQPQNSINPHSVAQYDVACFQLSNH